VRFREEESTVRRPDGFTLVEALIVVVLLGLIVLIGFPKISSALVQNDLRGARTTMVNMMAAARAAAVQSNRLTWIKFEGSTAHVVAQPRIDGALGVDTVGGVQDLSEQYGVSVVADEGSIQFDPRGFGTGLSDADTITIWRGGYSSTIEIDGLGRVRK
jgi:prepilin-type N-terminal cleavage/methylation domain-containing protein